MWYPLGPTSQADCERKADLAATLAPLHDGPPCWIRLGIWRMGAESGAKCPARDTERRILPSGQFAKMAG